MFIYLACPYTADTPAVQAFREAQASRATAHLLIHFAHSCPGVVVFSPITHGHAIAPFLPAPLRDSHDFWIKQCLPMLEVLDAELYVLCLPGWRQSKGVSIEILAAQELGRPIQYLNYNLEILDEAPDNY